MAGKTWCLGHWCGHAGYLLPVHSDWSVCMLYQLINILNKTLSLEHVMPINSIGLGNHLAIGNHTWKNAPLKKLCKLEWHKIQQQFIFLDTGKQHLGKMLAFYRALIFDNVVLEQITVPRVQQLRAPILVLFQSQVAKKETQVHRMRQMFSSNWEPQED